MVTVTTGESDRHALTMAQEVMRLPLGRGAYMPDQRVTLDGLLKVHHIHLRWEKSDSNLNLKKETKTKDGL